MLLKNCLYYIFSKITTIFTCGDNNYKEGLIKHLLRNRGFPFVLDVITDYENISSLPQLARQVKQIDHAGNLSLDLFLGF